MIRTWTVIICLALGLDSENQPYFSAVEEIQGLSMDSQKPIVVWVYGPHAEEARAQLNQKGRALTVPSLERGVKILARMAEYETWRQNTMQ